MKPQFVMADFGGKHNKEPEFSRRLLDLMALMTTIWWFNG